MFILELLGIKLKKWLKPLLVIAYSIFQLENPENFIE